MSYLFIRKIITAKYILFNSPQRLINIAGKNGLLNFLPDTVFLKLCFRCETGRKLDIKNPKTISEKLQWLKIHDHKDLYTVLVDKSAVRGYISKKFGSQFLIPIIGEYDSIDEIPWDKLPMSFVIKCTHGSGCNIVVKDKNSVNVIDIKKQLRSWLKQNWFYFGREWPYKSIEPRIIIEKYQRDNTQNDDLTDYKFYCFNGNPMYCQVIGDRHEENGSTVYYIDFYNMQWEKMPFTGFHTPGHPYPHSPNYISRPKSFEEMKRIALELSKNTKFVRIDFYEIDGFVKFGEFTLYPMSGFGVFSPDDWNVRLGNLIEI